MQEYIDFEIRISVIDDTHWSVVVHAPGGDAGGEQHIVAALTTNPTYQALAVRLANFDTDEAMLKVLGQLLFDTIFQGHCKEVYARTQGMLTSVQGMRLRLVIAPSATTIAALPWEFLTDPDQGPLALLDSPVVRYLPHSSRIPALEAPLPLKILLTAAQTSPPVEVERELRLIEEVLHVLEKEVQITVEPHLTRVKLQKHLRENFHIWHFVGHGGFDRGDTSSRLYLEDIHGDTDPVSAVELGILLNRSSIRLIVLDACESARLALDPFRSLAPALVRAQIPAIVAMQFPVPEETTRTFAIEFYRTLTEGFPIDACVTEGRKAVMGVSGLRRPDWGIPVVYTRAHDARIFKPLPVEDHAERASDISSNNQVFVPLEPPEGTMRPESPFYIERPGDKVALEAIHQPDGVTITIKGPRQVGKSSLLSRIAYAAERTGRYVANLDFQEFDEVARADANTFFRQFCHWLTDDLDLKNQLDMYWDSSLGNTHRCTRYLERYVLKVLDRPLLIAMDEVDNIIECPFRTDFFAMLRVWHNKRASKSIWRKLDLALVTSTEPYQLVDNLNQSPFNVGEVIDLTDFTRGQIIDLNHRHGTPLNIKELQQLIDLVGGHPYLMRRAMYLIANHRTTVIDLFTTAVADDGPFGDHLRRHLHRLYEKADLVQAMRQVLDDYTCPDERIFFRLRGAGLVSRREHEVRPRCQLYAAYFKDRL